MRSLVRRSTLAMPPVAALCRRRHGSRRVPARTPSRSARAIGLMVVVWQAELLADEPPERGALDLRELQVPGSGPDPHLRADGELAFLPAVGGQRDRIGIGKHGDDDL